MSTYQETANRLRELIEEGVLEETDPEEVVISDGFTDLLETALRGLRAQELAGEELPEDLLGGAVMLSYVTFLGKGGVSEEALLLKVSLLKTILEAGQENRLEEWAMKTRIRRLRK